MGACGQVHVADEILRSWGQYRFGGRSDLSYPKVNTAYAMANTSAPSPNTISEDEYWFINDVVYAVGELAGADERRVLTQHYVHRVTTYTCKQRLGISSRKFEKLLASAVGSFKTIWAFKLQEAS